MMGKLLHARPVHVPEIGAANRSGTRLALRQNVNLEMNVVVVRLALAQIGERLRRLLGSCYTERLQSRGGHHPWRDRGGEDFRLEWPERNILPLLDVACA